MRTLEPATEALTTHSGLPFFSWLRMIASCSHTRATPPLPVDRGRDRGRESATAVEQQGKIKARERTKGRETKRERQRGRGGVSRTSIANGVIALVSSLTSVIVSRSPSNYTHTHTPNHEPTCQIFVIHALRAQRCRVLLGILRYARKVLQGGCKGFPGLGVMQESLGIWVCAGGGVPS
eukprot:COSAG05_NODE_2489_length_2996_cov_3.985847_2_plen_179_part_00